MAVRFRYALSTHLGTVRTNNEDSAFGSDRLLVLADGMGGHAAGEVASAVAMRVFAGLGTGDAPAAETILAAGRRTRRALHTMSEADPMLESMGTTLLVVACDGDQVTVGHIGDSRVYALRDGSLYQVTTDHTHVQRLIDTGQLTPERARTHPYRSMLLKSLDDQPAGADLDIIDVELQAGDRLLLCSDGLSDYLSAEHIGELLSVPDREEAAHALVEAALAVGTRDNVTVLVADLEADARATDSSTPDGGVRLPGQENQVVGAAGEAIGLSAEAAAALRATLPDMPLDATAPMAGIAGIGATDKTDHTSDPDETATDEPAASESDHRDSTEAAPHDDQATEAAPSGNSDTSSGEGTRTGEPAPSGLSASTGSRLPGALAALTVLAIVIALWIILG
ncbi:protein phosphatase 2C domain-containing protein [Ruania alba]|uniref:Serine/threonine protein phosphatase PrpC n=1 Tax=Ruania alba TaxID=648782 RepID=A0A1H5L7Z6_9MICO|nr:protein phosphatase 2C domain-containing protein [Ruania alba]SEE72411.1 Serine/threonine protein phosphatase PrpC [Ruania alba]